MMFSDYNTRIEYIDALLSKISNSNNTKFYILCFFHYIVFIGGLYIPMVFAKKMIYLVICCIIMIAQLGFNIKDKGCFLMKLERRYVGKDWYGPYTLINYLYDDKIIDQNNLLIIYGIVTSIVFCTFIYKCISVNK